MPQAQIPVNISLLWLHSMAQLTLYRDTVSHMNRDLITWTLKQRRKAERSEAWEDPDGPLLVWRWRKAHKEECEQPQGAESEDPSWQPARDCILPTTWINLEADSSPEPPQRNATLLTLDFSLVRPWAENPAVSRWTHELQNCKLRNEYCFKLLSLG